jgi:lysyl-tRNA synthetase class II
MHEDYEWTMRFDMACSDGLSLTIDRMTMLLTDHPNIREVIGFPYSVPAKNNQG